MRHLMLLLATVALVLSTAPALADFGDQLAKLLAKDSEAVDQFGWSVAISGTTAIVGAPFDDDNGNLSGSAYLFDISDPANWTQIAKLLPDDGAEEDRFGSSVAIHGTSAIVGAYFDDDNGIDSGSAYLFDTSTGRQIVKLLPSDGFTFDLFGWSVAMSGNTAIVGAYQDGLGSAYVFDATTGQQIAKLIADDGGSSGSFGWSVAINGATAIVGATADDDSDPGSGSAFLFDISDPANWTQIAKLLPDDGAGADNFGLSVAISGSTAIVGAFRDDQNGFDSGSAYLFDTTSGQQIAKLLPDDGATEDRFGWSVAINGTTAIVGATFDDDHGSRSGSAYLFGITTGQQIAKLLASDGAGNDLFGVSVAITGTIAIIGARSADNGFASGSAYLFDVSCADSVECDDGLFCNGEETCAEGTCLPGLATCVDELCSEELDACVECLDDSHCDDSDACTLDICDPATGACPHNSVVCDDEDACTADSCNPAFGCQYGPLDCDDNDVCTEDDCDPTVGCVYLPAPCPGDLDCNGIVDASDLAALLGSWGPCDGCPADIFDDGDVNAGDLAILLGNWGPCL